MVTGGGSWHSALGNHSKLKFRVLGGSENRTFFNCHETRGALSGWLTELLIDVGLQTSPTVGLPTSDFPPFAFKRDPFSKLNVVSNEGTVQRVDVCVQYAPLPNVGGLEQVIWKGK